MPQGREVEQCKKFGLALCEQLLLMSERSCYVSSRAIIYTWLHVFDTREGSGAI